MDDVNRRAELRDFLRTRRARLTPADVGMPEAGRRRTPGLRREEVAVIAGVGVSWYTWLEQGRDINVSGSVLDAIARALRLDATEREYLYLLAGLNPPVGDADGGPRQGVPPELLRVLEAWSPRPAYVRDRYWNFVAVNDAARAVYGFRAADHNWLVTYFTNARYRAMHADWSTSAAEVAARFRADAARFPDDPEFARIADDLRTVSDEFAELWARHDVSRGHRSVKSLDHPDAGRLVFEATMFPVPECPGQNLILQNPVPGSGTAEALDRLVAMRTATAG